MKTASDILASVTRIATIIAMVWIYIDLTSRWDATRDAGEKLWNQGVGEIKKFEGTVSRGVSVFEKWRPPFRGATNASPQGHVDFDSDFERISDGAGELFQ